MRILWHGIGPWWPTGYGLQTAMIPPRLAALGHELVISQMNPPPAGAGDTATYEGIPVVGPAKIQYAVPWEPVLAAFGGHRPDLILILKDAWVLNPAAFKGRRAAIWMAFDCRWTPAESPDLAFLRESGAIPIACSLDGHAQLAAAGQDAFYIPPGIECDQWRPGDRAAARKELGLPERAFIAGINAMNVGSPSRKGFPEQMQAFARFHAKHPDSLLLVHAKAQHPEGIDLHAVTGALGLDGHVLFPSTTMMSHDAMLTWYQALDVLMAASYGEGAGMPITEAMACGVPVIAARSSAMTEKITPGTGWLVDGQDWWNPHHRAWWKIPYVHSLVTALEKARCQGHGPSLTRALTAAAAAYDTDHVTSAYWKPVLDELAGSV